MKPKKTRISGAPIAKTHFITIWPKSLENLGIYADIEKDPEKVKQELQSYFTEIGGSHYTAICVSAKGEYHVHEVVTFDKAKRCTAVAKLYGKSHVEVMRGTKEQAKDYIEKNGQYAEKGEKIILKWGDPGAIENNAGTRTDLAEFDEKALDSDFDLDTFLLEKSDPTVIKMYTDRFYRLKRVHARELRDIKVIYIEGQPGTGKSNFVYTHNNFSSIFKVSCDQKTAFPFDGYKCESTLWLDELRPGQLNTAYLLQLLDKYPLNVNIKGGSAPACWDTVYITSAVPLEEWYKKRDDYEFSDDLRKQFFRRITGHLVCYKVNGEYSVKSHTKLLSVIKKEMGV